MCEEVRKAIQRYRKFVLGRDNNDYNLIVLSPKETVTEEIENSRDKLLLVIGSRARIDESGFGFLGEMFPSSVKLVDLSNIHPISFSFDSGRGIDLAPLQEDFDRVKQILKDAMFPELSLYEFSGKYGKHFSSEPKAVQGHQSEDEVRFFGQMILYLGGMQLLRNLGFSSEAPLKILYIENNIERKMETIDSRLAKFLKAETSLKDVINVLFNNSRLFEFYIHDGREEKYGELYRKLLAKVGKGNPEDAKVRVKKLDNEGNLFEYGEVPLRNFNFILVDIFLGNDVPDGVDFINLFRELIPHVPAFILSMSDSVFTIQEAIKKGADFYIMKNQIFSLPLTYVKYINSMGEAIKLLDDKKYRRSITGNTRYWGFKKNMLWYGDKCYHMVDHSYNHTLDDWRFVNSVLSSLAKEVGKENFLKIANDSSTVSEEDVNEYKKLKDKILYSFLMGVWLHDIGHKGSAEYGDAHLIRDNHGYISGKWILKYPYLFGFAEEDDYYRKFEFDNVSAIEALYNREGEPLSIVEMTALFAMYHKSNTPLDKNEANTLLGKGKNIPLEYYPYRDKKRPPITLRDILEKRGFGLNDSEKEINIVRTFVSLEALFRLLDAIDIRNVRSGTGRELKMKLAIDKEDEKFLLRKLQLEINNMLNKQSNLEELPRLIMARYFLVDLREKLERGEIIKFEIPPGFVDETTVENLKNLVDFAAFISFNPTHLYLHSSVKDITIFYRGRGKFLIIIDSDRTKEELDRIEVKERARKPQTVFERLVGRNNYIFSEVEGAKRFLSEWLSEVKVELRTSDGKSFSQSMKI